VLTFPPIRARLTAALAALVLLAGCSAMQAQNPSSPLRPVNAVADESGQAVMLKGHDVVAYFTDGRHAMGLPAFSSQYQGVTFRFASAEHKALFDAAPQKYLPQFGGYCANGIAYGIPWGGDADTWKIIDGRLYIFGGQASKDAFELDEAGNLALAQKYWREEVAGRHSFVQRAWRLVFRVPHYKSGEQLAREVEAARAKRQGG
jgi:YHS domain-containing protein